MYNIALLPAIVSVFFPFFNYASKCQPLSLVDDIYQICSRIASAKLRDERFEKLFVKKDLTSAESHGQLFVDTAVYSRNRCFRLALSSKAGKTSFLLPTGRFKCKDMV